MLKDKDKLNNLERGYESSEEQVLRTKLFILSGPDAFPVCNVSNTDLTSVRFVTNCVKLFGFDCMICVNSLPASFRSDCVLKYELSKLAFSLSSVYIITFSFRVGSDALSLVELNDFRVFHQSLLLKLWLKISLLARLSK